MVAYNFQTRFAEPIRSGVKRHTIRRNGKRRHARVGESLQLYTGMRTKSCRKIIRDPICAFVFPVEILVGKTAIERIKFGPFLHTRVSDLDGFAVSDGFSDAADMHAFFLQFHGVGLFTDATLISW